MDIDKIMNENQFLKLEIEILKKELYETKEHLKKYTAPGYKKEYYEKNKEVIKEKNNNYKKTTNYKPTQEQKKEYNKNAYLRRKEKLNNNIE